MKPSIRLIALIAAVGLPWVATAPSRAQNLYVASQFSSTVGEYNAKSGGLINASFVSGFKPQNLAFSGNHLYVTNLIGSIYWTVGEYNAITGQTINPLLIAGVNPPQGLAVSKSNLYLSSSNRVEEYNATTGAAINDSFISLRYPKGLAVSGSNLYVLYVSGTGSIDGARQPSYVSEYNAATGAIINPTLVTGLVEPRGLVVSGGNLYVGSALSRTVGEYDAATGAPINASLISSLNPPQDLAISGSNLYVLYLSGAASGSYVGRYSAKTGAVINGSLVTGLVQPTAIAVSPPPPVVTGSLSATGTNGLPFRYRITASNDPFGFNAIGLPKGLEVDNSTGLISGRPVESGTFAVILRAMNSAGTGSATLSLVVITPPAPVISSALSATGTSGVAFRYQIAASNVPTSFAASGLPHGLSVNKTSGLISGKTSETGTYAAGIEATNAGGTGSAPLTLTILPPPPVITSGLTALSTFGLAFNYRITAGNGPVSFNATGLPGGLNVDHATGLISGTADEAGRFRVIISAANAGGTGSATLDIAVNFTGVKGAYAGLVALSGTPSGLLTIALTSRGGFTGRLTLAGVQYPLTGTFFPSGTFSGTLSKGGVTLDVALSIDASLAGIGGIVAVAANGGIDTCTVETSRLGAMTAGKLTAGLAGRYTAIIPGVSGTDPTLPHAPGFGTMTLGTRGAVRIAGRLGDGTVFTMGGQLDADGTTCALFTPLYGKANPGSIAGTISFENSADSDWEGMFGWIKPAAAGDSFYPGGFSLGVELMAAKYSVALLPSGAWSFSLGGGDLPAGAISDTLTLVGTRAVVNGVNDGGVTLTLAPATGAFNGTFHFPGTGRETPFGGVIYEKPVPAGLGQFPGANQVGGVEVTQ